VRCETDGIPPETSVANWYKQTIGCEQHHASLTVNIKGTLKLRKKRYFYMDVGKWLNGRQYFGAVCGRLAVLCQYSPDVSTGEIPLDVPSGGLLDRFLRSGGIEPDEERCRIILPPYQGDPDHLYVILPDIHLPQAVSPQDEEKRLRWNVYRRIMQILEPDHGRMRDVFGSIRSADALTKFLQQLVKFYTEVRAHLPNAKITLIQIGDMYELWGHRPCYFLQRDRPEVLLVEPRDASAHIIGEWISGTHFLYQELFQAFDTCTLELTGCVFLHGNHDSYLSVPAVVKSANQRQVELPGLAVHKFGFEIAGSGEWGADYKTTTIHPRLRE
jgi:hypothetical protein